MAWTKTTRKQYRRTGLRYASDTTAMEWMLLRRLLPKRAHLVLLSQRLGESEGRRGLGLSA
jgi:hypothetical protein